MPKLVLVKAKVFWGYSIKCPAQSAAQESVPLPPPTTAIGALAASYARYMKLPEALRIKNNVFSTTVKLLADKIVRYGTSGLINLLATKYSDMNRNIMIIYQRRKEREFHFAAQAMGKIYVSGSNGYMSDNLILAYVVDDAHVELITKIAWGITSIGSKEGLVSVDDVVVYDIATVDEKVVETPFVTPASIARCSDRCVEVEMCTLSEESYLAGKMCKTSPFLVPVSREINSTFGRFMRVEVGRNVAVSKITLENKPIYIVIPSEVVSQ